MALTNFYSKIRDLIQDQLMPDYYAAEFTGTSRTFIVQDSTVDADTVKVYVNQTEVLAGSGGSNWDFDATSSRLTFSDTYPLNNGDVIEIYYSAYKKYTNSEIRQYLSSAIIRLSVNRYQTFILRSDDTIFPTPVESDENLLCLVASILMEGNISLYKTNEVMISFMKDEDNEERIRVAVRQFKKCYGVIDYHNTRRPYTMYVEDSDMTLENLP